MTFQPQVQFVVGVSIVELCWIETDHNKSNLIYLSGNGACVCERAFKTVNTVAVEWSKAGGWEMEEQRKRINS